MDITTSFSFRPTINKPTRISNTSATLIDNVFTNILPSPKSGILLTDISDHLPIFMIMPSCKFDVSSNNHIISTHSRNLIPPSHWRRGATTVFGQNLHDRSDTASSFS